MKHKITQKAYQIDLTKINKGFMYSEIFSYAENLNKAKYILLKMVEYEDMALRNGDEVNYINVPVIRCKEADKYQFEDKELTLNEIDKIRIKRIREESFDKLLNDNSITHCYIRKGSYYRPGSCGYTDMIHRAGVFTKEEAVSDAKSCQDLTIVPINIIRHNKMINEEINDLKSRILEPNI